MVIEVLEARKLMSVSPYPTAEFDAVRNAGDTGTAGDRCDPYAGEWNYDVPGRLPDLGGDGTTRSTVVTDSGDGDVWSTCSK